MLGDSIRRWNPWWQKGSVSTELIGVQRIQLKHVMELLESKMIINILGPRRSGKTTLIYQMINSLLLEGIDPKSIILLNFDDYDLFSVDFDTILAESFRISPDIDYLFLDEVQERTGWERFVRTLFDTKKFKQIVMTGSSSSILSSELSRVLTGRFIPVTILPFSFREYLASVGFEILDIEYLENQKDVINHYLENFLNNGGFPGTIKLGENSLLPYMNSLLDGIVARDIAARHNIDFDSVRRIIHFMISNSSKTVTLRSISRATGVSVDTVSRYVQIFEEPFLLFPVRKFSFKLKERIREICKYYPVDTGLARSVTLRFSEDRGRMVETLVFIELRRRYGEKNGSEIFFWRSESDKEVDFIVFNKGSIVQALQVSTNIENQKTLMREMRSLLECLSSLGLDSGILINEQVDRIDEIEGMKIILMPLWKWLLIGN